MTTLGVWVLIQRLHGLDEIDPLPTLLDKSPAENTEDVTSPNTEGITRRNVTSAEVIQTE